MTTSSTTATPIPTSTIPIPDLSSTVPLHPSESPYTHSLPSPFSHSSSSPVTLLTQGAEALVYKTVFLSPRQPAVLKYRPSKPYRHPTLDARLTKQRVLAEARVLVRLAGLKAKGVAVPGVLGLEWDVARGGKGGRREEGERGKGAWLVVEFIEGRTVKELLREWDAWRKGLEATEREGEDAQRGREEEEEEVKRLLRRVGRAVGLMHSVGGVVHGDLTSSNIMVRSARHKDPNDNGDNEIERQGAVDTSSPSPSPSRPDLKGEIVLIDFGLATQSVQDEDRAVDLYVLERAFGSTHPRQEGWFDQEVLQSQDGYRGAYKGASGILKRLEEVRMRGRKRTMIG